MTPKEYLLNIGKMKRAIEAKREKIRSLEELATSATQTITGMPHNPSSTKSRMADAVCKKVDLEREIAQLEAERSAAIAYLNTLPDTEETTLLIKRYVRELTWEDIAIEMHYGRTKIYELHKAAVAEFEKRLKREHSRT